MNEPTGSDRNACWDLRSKKINEYMNWKFEIKNFKIFVSFKSSNFAINWSYTQRNLFGILLNQTEIRLYSPFSDWFRTKRMSVWFQIKQKIVNTIWFRFDVIWFRKDFSVCELTGHTTICVEETIYIIYNYIITHINIVLRFA